MVKTRSQAHQQQKKNVKKAPKGRSPKNDRTQSKKSTINHKQLRTTIKAKISKPAKKGQPRQPKKVDFGHEQFITITNPEKFNCPICLQIMIIPTISQCGHAFCLPCIQQCLKHKRACSLCRQSLTYEQFKESILIKDIMHKVINRALSQEEMGQYHERVKAFQTKDAQRRVANDVAVGDLVDFYIEDSWHEGIIIEKKQDEEKQMVLNIESKQKNTLKRQLKLTSRLLSKHHTFTKEKSLFQNLMGQFRLEISAFRDLPFVNLNQFELYPIPINVRRQTFDQSGDVMRITFSFQPPEQLL